MDPRLTPNCSGQQSLKGKSKMTVCSTAWGMWINVATPVYAKSVIIFTYMDMHEDAVCLELFGAKSEFQRESIYTNRTNNFIS